MLYRVALGDTLRELRHEQCLTLRKVASKSTISLGYLSEVERGTKEISSELLIGLANTFGMSVGELISIVGTKMMLEEGVINPLSLAFDKELVNH